MVASTGESRGQDNADRPGGDLQRCRLRQAQKLSPDSSAALQLLELPAGITPPGWPTVGEEVER